ncbi:DUF1656 domain-containing protein [Teichococcus vastitatis]|uniref:DUF1656 domain-containing protein n=1 Tax=Teichococcus vastitatis TaxID=2307076 RepID=A0ABS9WAZ0_9PROT|nr:DUF1656 domain-containing protein [Pseudoroseomonas vastitatis]MCI0756464.1 DUF1656 domain-containing protein [Pseudoroseomonas vastitatis]
MIAELDVYGVFMPALLVWAIIAMPLTALLRRLLLRLGAYRWIWHAPLFDLALFVLVLGGVTAASEWML